MSLRAVILDEIRRIAEEHNKTLGRLEDEAPLLSVGLGSLGFAVLAAHLEEGLKVEPFNGDHEVEFPTTLGDLIRRYEGATPRA